MALIKVSGIEYSIEPIAYGAKKCDACGKLCGCARKVNSGIADIKAVYICYKCSGGHWKKALKIAIGIIGHAHHEARP